MAFYAYILKCANGKYYTGHTNDLEKRIGQHQSGLIKGYTSARLPVSLMWAQDFPTRYEALDAELKIKGWSQAKKEALIRGDWEGVSFFAKPPKKRGVMPHGVSTMLDTNGEGESAASRSVRIEPSRDTSPVETPIGHPKPISPKPKPTACP
jgi:putative endonuclease